jgi:hypothetical protein
MNLACWQLLDFNLEGQIGLSDKHGLVKVCKSEDGTLMLVTNSTFRMIDHTKATPLTFAKADSVLGFVLDIGIQRTKELTLGHGFYFGRPVSVPQSRRLVTQAQYDDAMFDKIMTSINKEFQSGDRSRTTSAIRSQLLIDAYNDARLLFPNFYSDSYLSLLRIIEATCRSERAIDFGARAASISASLNKAVADKITAVAAYADKVKKASDIYATAEKKARDKGMSCHKQLAALDAAGQLIFACFFSAYQYRSKFVHVGFPFPPTVKTSFGIEDDAGTAYLDPSLGFNWVTVMRPEAPKDSDLIDLHEIIEPKVFKKFKDEYFHLLPTWHFMKMFTREALRQHLKV